MSGEEIRPTYKGFLQASGKAETWGKEKTEKEQVQSQLGWLEPQNAYSPSTLIGNWNEKRFDVSLLAQPKPLPSQYNHYFETTYRQSYLKSPPKVPEALKYSRGEGEPKAFPSHQPVLDPPEFKRMYNSFVTTSTAAYGQAVADEGSRRKKNPEEEHESTKE